MSKKSEVEKAESIERLREWGVKPGTVLYTIVRHVAKSGMSRRISVVTIDSEDGGMLHLDYHVAKAIGERLGADGITVSGCGMDMGFHIVYNLGRVMFPQGFECIGESCRSNDHSNGDRNYAPHHHSDGGYALVQRWL